jgi:toxin ParE1/3/4
LKRYRLSPDARRDVRQIWAYIAADNEAAANRVIREFNNKFEFLGRNPRAGRSRDDVQPGLRTFPFEDYLIFYRIISAGVRVVRVVHGARDLRPLLH